MISSWGAYSAGRFVIGVPVSRRMFPVLGMFLAMCFAAFVRFAAFAPLHRRSSRSTRYYSSSERRRRGQGREGEEEEAAVRAARSRRRERERR